MRKQLWVMQKESHQLDKLLMNRSFLFMGWGVPIHKGKCIIQSIQHCQWSQLHWLTYFITISSICLLKMLYIKTCSMVESETRRKAFTRDVLWKKILQFWKISCNEQCLIMRTINKKRMNVKLQYHYKFSSKYHHRKEDIIYTSVTDNALWYLIRIGNVI